MEPGVKKGVQRATTTITLSNPVQKRFNSKLTYEKPQVKVIVTEIFDESSETFQPKPRKPRKADLSKCIKEQDGPTNEPDNSKDNVATEQFIYLGDTEGLDLEGKDFQNSFSLHRFAGPGREETQTGDVVYYVQCPECNKKLKQKSYRSHVRTHSGVKQFKCDLCEDRFTRRNDVMRHKRLIHEKPRDFKCEQCDKYFVSEENLTSHRDKHNVEMKCRVCHHGFGKRDYYENHIKFVHPNGGQYIQDEESIEDPDNPAEVDNVNTEQANKHEDTEPSILRKGEKRKIVNVNEKYKSSKLMFLGGPESNQKLLQTEMKPSGDDKTETLDKIGSVREVLQSSQTQPIKLSSVSTKLVAGEQLGPDLLEPCKQDDEAIHIVDSSGNIGQILKISDGTFMIVDCEEESQENQQSDQDNSQDAVQTLIDAVQELIQTHEACEKESDEIPKTAVIEASESTVEKPALYVDEDNKIDHAKVIPQGATVILAGDEGSGQLISEEVWRNLKEVYPDAEFVVVTNQ